MRSGGRENGSHLAGQAGLDAVDRRLIEALQRDGRVPFRRLADEIGVSEATIRARYARLTERNLLQVVGVTNPLGLGFDAIAMLGVKVHGPAGPVGSEIAQWREATYVVLTGGQFDLLVELVCADRPHLLETVERVRALDAVLSADVFVYLALEKQQYDWGARAS